MDSHFIVKGERVDPRDLTNLATFARRIGFSYAGVIRWRDTWDDFPKPVLVLPGTSGLMKYYLTRDLVPHHRHVLEVQIGPRLEKQARSAVFYHLLQRTLATRMTAEAIKKFSTGVAACEALDINYRKFD